MIKKIVHPCDVPLWDGKKYPLFCRIEFSDGGRLSISGVIGPTKSGNAMGSCGQVDSNFWHPTRRPDPELIKPSALRFAKGWTLESWLKFLRYWDEWHLNDVRAECIHQRAMGMSWTTFPHAQCKECGHVLGHSWAKHEVPSWVIQFLESLPDSDCVPN